MADEFEQPAAQAVVGLVAELGDECVEVFGRVGAQQGEAVFLLFAGRDGASTASPARRWCPRGWGVDP